MSLVALLSALWGGISVCVVGFALTMLRPPMDAKPVADQDPIELSSPEVPPDRVVLLCMDGVDLDEIVLPMVERGELPNMKSMMTEGSWGPLETLEPTISPALWTTIITGKSPEEHGILHFYMYSLPGVEAPIHGFPRQTGLNFRLIPMLDGSFGLDLLTPYASTDRRAPALWNIVGSVYPVGNYRWLVSGPVEEIRGFNVGGSVHLGGNEGADGARLDVAPADVYAGISTPELPEIDEDAIRPFSGPDVEIDFDDPGIFDIVEGLDDPTGYYLPRLIEKYDAKFTSAAFYNVDSVAHHYSAARGRNLSFSNAVEERYRYADARLGEFLETMGPETNVIVVSDHGFDFTVNHHIYAPAGSFFARGPAFESGRYVEGLTLYDIAPLVLRLLDLPVAEDMSGVSTGAYEKALAQDFLASQPEERIASYDVGWNVTTRKIEESDEEGALKARLRSLGYIE